MDIGARVREVRKDLGMPQAELARRVETARNHIVMIEAGSRTPSVALLERIAHELRIEPAELLREPGEEPLMDLALEQPEVQEWLAEQGHMNREEFLSWAEELESLEEVEDAIGELKLLRDKLLDDLRRVSGPNILFGPPRVEGLTGKAWTREVFRPRKLATRLGNKLRNEYLAREVALENYSRVLFVEGRAEDYLVRSPITEHDHERHQQMLAARASLALRESYAEELAAV